MEDRKQVIRHYVRRGLSVKKAVAIAGISRSCFYYREREGKPGLKPSTHTGLTNGSQITNHELVEVIKDLLDMDFVDYGYLKVTHWLNQQGFEISKHKVYRLMKENQLLHANKKPMAKRSFVQFSLALPEGPLELLEMDIKFIYIHGTGRNALVLTIIDTFNREVLAWVCSYSIKKQDVIALIESLIENYLQPYDMINRDIRVIIRSDNGSQFIANMVRAHLRSNFIVQEFTRPATPQQNAHIESFHSIVRRLVEERFEFESLGHLNEILEAFYHFYNNSRLHSSLCYLSPRAFLWAFENGFAYVDKEQKKPGKRMRLSEKPVNIIDMYKKAIFEPSSEAESGPAGEQPDRNNLTDWNGHGEYAPHSIHQFHSSMPQKTQQRLSKVSK
jgi:putative transposase